ncbi:MAG TPA: helix-turn-helix transcriptional regulator [bacterium]|nr:helix-turn-helix transcriptional regulator [bacterium]
MGLPARKIESGSEKKIEEVSLSMDGRRLIFLFENGEGCAVSRKSLPGDDGTSIIALQIFDHRGAVSVSQASGTVYDLPWDSIKHYARGGKQRSSALGERVKKLRKERELTQENLARAVGISRIQMNRIESDVSKPGLETMMRLAEVLGITLKDMV